jgi:hypothetical protein
MTRTRDFAATFIVLALSSCLLGCNSGTRRPPTYPVTGTVTFKGKPLERAAVVFVPTDRSLEAASGITDATGKYELTSFVSGDGAQAGEYKVKVSQYDTHKATTEEKKQYMTIEEEQKLSFAKDELPTPPAKNMLPKKYENETTSGITHTVTKGPTTLDIKIE